MKQSDKPTANITMDIRMSVSLKVCVRWNEYEGHADVVDVNMHPLQEIDPESFYEYLSNEEFEELDQKAKKALGIKDGFDEDE